MILNYLLLLKANLKSEKPSGSLTINFCPVLPVALNPKKFFFLFHVKFFAAMELVNGDATLSVAS
jgi:hypothetical protein